MVHNLENAPGTLAASGKTCVPAESTIHESS